MSRFRSESRFMDPHKPAKSQARPIVPFYQNLPTPEAAHAEAEGHGFYFELDHEEALQGLSGVLRHGIYRRGFRKNGPEIGEGHEVNG